MVPAAELLKLEPGTGVFMYRWLIAHQMNNRRKLPAGHNNSVRTQLIEAGEKQVTLGRNPVQVIEYRLRLPDGSVGEFRTSGSDTVTVERLASCDAPCCEVHSRNVGDQVDYCAEHWNAWQFIS